MELWRISNYADLKGRGGVKAAGRWHSAGRPIVYCATSPAGALLEILVQQDLRAEELPVSYQLLRVNGPDGSSRARVDSSKLAPDWTEHLEISRAIGDEWLVAGAKLTLDVPSAIVPATSNVLINPGHRDVEALSIESLGRYPFDPRLLR